MMDDVYDPMAKSERRFFARAARGVECRRRAVGVTAYLSVPARRSSAPLRKRQALIAYLRDHLGGAGAAQPARLSIFARPQDVVAWAPVRLFDHHQRSVRNVTE